MKGSTRSRAAARIVASLCAAFIVSQFYRSSTAVIAPELIRDMGLSAEALGGLTGIFYLTFAVAQVPVGVLLDRFGPRRTVAGLLGFAGGGALVFAAAQTPWALTLGRALMGLGCAGVFMGSLVVCARWYAPDRFATVAAVILSVGGTGNLFSTTPLALAAEAVGWRGAFVGMAAITAALCALVWVVVRDAPPGHPYHARRPESLGQTIRGLREVLTNPRLPYILAISFVAYPAVATVLGLWAGPYLNDVYGLDAVDRGNVLLMATGAMVIGTLCYGPLDRVFDTRKRIVVCGALITAAVLAALALAPALALWQAAALLVALGGFGIYAVMIIAHGRAIFPERLVGRGITVVNFANFSGVAVMQMAAGLIVGAFPATDGAAPEAAYRLVFGFLAATIVLALMFYARAADAKPSEAVPAA